MRSTIVLLLAAALGMGCGGQMQGRHSSPVNEDQVTGADLGTAAGLPFNYTGSYEVAGLTGTLSIAASLSGTALTGTVEVAGAESGQGTLTGTLDGNLIHADAALPFGTVHLEGTLAGDLSISGTLSVAALGATGTFTVAPAPPSDLGTTALSFHYEGTYDVAGALGTIDIAAALGAGNTVTGTIQVTGATIGEGTLSGTLDGSALHADAQLPIGIVHLEGTLAGDFSITGTVTVPALGATGTFTLTLAH